MATIELEDDTLIPLHNKITGQQLFKDNKFDEEFIETEEVQFGQSLYPGAHFLNRQQLQDVYLDSPAYGRSKLGNCYASFKMMQEEVFGQILYFVRISQTPFCGETRARIKLFEVIEHIGPIKGFFRVHQISKELLQRVRALRKVLHFADISQNQRSLNPRFVIKLCANFAHS